MTYEKPDLSVDDNEFLKVLEKGFQNAETRNWIAPLAYGQSRQRLPKNKTLALHRARSLHNSL